VQGEAKQVQESGKMAFDIVIRNGSIVDGSGAEPYVGDIAIVDGVIAEMGKVTGTGSQEIDAQGHFGDAGLYRPAYASGCADRLGS
jgi:N-acyl-D-aspartate/D-glutamate deacylase